MSAALREHLAIGARVQVIPQPHDEDFFGFIEEIVKPRCVTACTRYRIRRERPIEVGGVLRTAYWTYDNELFAAPQPLVDPESAGLCATVVERRAKGAALTEAGDVGTAKCDGADTELLEAEVRDAANRIISLEAAHDREQFEARR